MNIDLSKLNIDVAGAVGKVVSQGISGLGDTAVKLIEALVPDPNKAAEAKLALEQEATKLVGIAQMAEAERLKDVQSARELYKSDSLVQKILALFFTVTYFAMTIFMLFLMQKVSLSDTQNNLLFTVFGATNAIMVTVIGFYFGSSKSSKDKDDVIAATLKASRDQ